MTTKQRMEWWTLNIGGRGQKSRNMGGLYKVEKRRKSILPYSLQKKHQPAGLLILDFWCIDYHKSWCYLKPLSCSKLLQQQHEINTLIMWSLKPRQGGKRWSDFFFSWGFTHLGSVAHFVLGSPHLKWTHLQIWVSETRFYIRGLKVQKC